MSYKLCLYRKRDKKSFFPQALVKKEHDVINYKSNKD